MKQDLPKRLLVFLLMVLFTCRIGEAGTDRSPAFDSNRAKLLAYLVHERLEKNHFANKTIDDNLSEAAFSLYIKQLDFQKRILLQEDFEYLRKYSQYLDDEIKSGLLELPLKGSEIFAVRAAKVYETIKRILSEDFDFSVRDFIETDPEKLNFCSNEEELRERWRKILKYQVLQQYLGQQEEPTPGPESQQKPPEEPKDKKQPPDEELRKSAREKVLKTYDQFFSRIAQEKNAEHYERFFSAFTNAFDPHTDYMPPMNKEDFDINMRGSLEGIGATLKEDDNYIKVVSIIVGSPAARQGQLQPEDIILRVGEGSSAPVDIIGMRVKDAVRLIRGKKGTEVRLTIKKPDETILTIPIVRDIIQMEDTFVKGELIKDDRTGDHFGYLKVPSFYRDFEKTGNGEGGRNSTVDFRAELNALKRRDMKGLIIDLRNNGGGALADAVKIAGLFIKTGPVVQVKNSSGRITTLSDDESDIVYDGPVVILVNTFSASASEILAGALQDYNRAVIMGGAHTHGKGTVQTILNLDENVPFRNMDEYKPLGALKLTIQKFYRISGESTQYRGVIPDMVLPDVMNNLKTGEQYLDFALPWDTVKPVDFLKWTKCGPDLAELKEKSIRRSASNQKLVEMKNEAVRLEAKQKHTLKSLNIDDVRKEIEESRSQKEKAPKNAHGHSKSNKDAKTTEEKKEAFLKELMDDAYVNEAIAVLEDIITADPSCISVTAN